MMEGSLQLFVTELPGVGTINIHLSSQDTVEDLKKVIWTRIGYSWPLLLLYRGKPVTREERLARFVDGSFLQVRPLGVLKGGKGGFGTLLRGQAAFRKKSQNISSCRDLEGRRLRDVEAEKRLHQWYAEREQRKHEQDAQQTRRNEDKEQTKRQQEAKKTQVGNTCRVVEANTESAVTRGLVASRKRKQSDKGYSEEYSIKDGTKKRWMFSLLEDSSDSSESCGTEEEEQTSCVNTHSTLNSDTLLSLETPLCNTLG